MKKILTFIAMTCLAAGLVLAADDNKANDGAKKRSSDSSAGLRERIAPAGAGGRVSRNQMLSQAKENRTKQHKKEIAELNAIKKIAQEEEATRTVEAIQTLIDKKNEAFKKAQTEIEQKRQERAKQVRDRMQSSGEKSDGEKKEKEEQKDDD